MIPSKRQAAIYNEWKSTDNNILIQAVAGSGKTTVLVELMKLCGKDDKILYIAFNKDIKESTQIKMNNIGVLGRAQTIHSLGLDAIKFVTPNVETNFNKNWLLLSELEKRLPSYFKVNPPIFNKREDVMKLKYTLMDMNDVSRSYLEDDPDTIFELMTEMDKMYFSHEALDIGLLWDEFMNIREEYYARNPLIIDFTDMIYLPARNDYYIPRKPDYLMLDECQDFNYAQHKIIDNIINQGDIKKWIAVGDRNQCQPKGTKILMRDLTEKNIEDLQIGDEVISYHKEKTQFVGFGKSYNSRGYKVLDKKLSYRADTVFTVNLSTGHKSSYTSNHKCYLQFNEEKLKGKYAVYLMRKGKSFRIGIAPCYSQFKANAFGPVMRARAEGADDLWILKIFNTREEAYLHEQILSYKFKIPQMMFTLKNNSIMTQENLDIFWYEMKDLTENGKNILRWFNREIAFPLWTNTGSSQGGLGNSWKLSSKTMFKTQACNILPEVMNMCIFDINNRDSKGRVVKKIVSIESLKVNMKVEEFISLDIEENHNYVADGILTSNSIYGFSGAHAASFDLFKDKPNVVEMPLDICYRCPISIVNSANEVYDVMEAFKQEKGKILYLNNVKDNLHLFRQTPEAMIICRNKSPLLLLYFDLIENGIPSKLVGNDFRDSLVRFLKSYTNSSISRAKMDIENEIYELEQNLNSEQKKIRCAVMKENYKNFLTLSTRLKFSSKSLVSDLIASFLKLFEGSNNIISLCTIHKSKGLEADYVYILNENLIPSPFARSEQQLVQEQNLKYVARTRAKKEMYFLTIKSEESESL